MRFGCIDAYCKACYKVLSATEICTGTIVPAVIATTTTAIPFAGTHPGC